MAHEPIEVRYVKLELKLFITLVRLENESSIVAH